MSAGDRRKAAKQISWEAILMSLEDGVVVVDLSGNVRFMNQAAEALTEISSSQAVGAPAARLFRHNLWVLELLREERSSGGRTRTEGTLVTPWGRQIPISLTLSPLEDSTGRTQGTILALRDQTYRRVLEEDLARAERLSVIGSVAAGLAHEIKNPLGGIKGAAQLLRREAASHPPLAEYAELITREADRVNRLLEQLLDLSRPVELQLEALNVHELLDQVLRLEQQARPRGRVTITRRFDPSLPPVRGDRNRLTQVFLNLVKNALEALDAGGELTVSTRLETDFHIREAGKKPERLIWVEFRDTGPGIRPEDLPRIFEPFYTTKNHGSGLGLAISERIVREHGGLIRVESQPGQGASFRVALPVAS
jgi:two-component system nitrogen regulation sensor histidine kinase GlnL